jgi:asparagine synthase (glutamine-hydrolysing)
VCGIAGFTFTSGPVDESLSILESMCESVRRRGPDSHGLTIQPGAALGMRRLAIVDVEGGQQPLWNEDESIVLVCNGEIYNAPELRRQLEAQGHRFRTHSDCEALVHAYERWGLDFLTHINGMFAFALWDKNSGGLVLGRDRSGIKPLHYALVPGGIVFGSEIKALLKHPDVSRELDPTSLLDYLVFEYVSAPRSIFRDVRKLPAGHYLTYHPRGGCRIQRYWDLELGGANGPINVPETIDQLRTALERAVTMELMSDVPVGVFLSGGLDSSTVAALAARHSSEVVQTFSIAFDDPSFDESRYSRLMAQHLGTRHNEAVLRPKDLQDLLPEITEFLDEPMGDSSLVPTYFLAKSASRQVKVVLGGDGGDELFAGYPTLQAHKVAGYAERAPRALKSLFSAAAARLPVSRDNISFDFRLKRFAAALNLDLPARHQLWVGSLSHGRALECLNKDVRGAIDPEREAYQPALQYLEHCQAGSAIDRVLYMDFKLYLESDILVKVDRSSMACGLEVRVPLLNQVLVEQVRRLPGSLKFKGLTTKYLLKQAAKGLVPDEIIHRPKKGFNMPVARWFAGDLRSLLTDALDSHRIRQQGLFDVASVQQLLDDHLAGRSDNRKPLWTLFIFQQWYERYGAGSDTTRLPALEPAMS